MKKFVPLLVCFYASQLLALDCARWAYPQTENPSQMDEEVPVAEYSSGLLWKVRNKTGQVSYLFGTIHLSDHRVIELSKFVEPYLMSVNNFAMEVLVTAEIPELLSKKMFYFDGRELGDYLEADVFNRTISLLRQHGLDDYAASRLKPWAAYMTLSVPPAENNVPLDMHLLNRATVHGLSSFGIESIEEQLALFEDLAIEEQVALLTESICNYVENQSQIDVMLSTYLEQDLGGLLRLGKKYQTPVNEELLRRLLDNRNIRMAARIRPWLDGGDFFIAVGALHLPGAKGLLRILRQQGYELEPIDAVAR